MTGIRSNACEVQAVMRWHRDVEAIAAENRDYEEAQRRKDRIAELEIQVGAAGLEARFPDKMPK
jgi:hypothetical protein